MNCEFLWFKLSGESWLKGRRMQSFQMIFFADFTAAPDFLIEYQLKLNFQRLKLNRLASSSLRERAARMRTAENERWLSTEIECNEGRRFRITHSLFNFCDNNHQTFRFNMPEEPRTENTQTEATKNYVIACHLSRRAGYSARLE